MADEASLRNVSERLSLFTNRDTRNAATVQLAKLWAAEDVVSAAGWADQLGSGKKDAIPVVARAWAVQSPQDAASWILGMEDPHVRSGALQALVSTWTRTDPHATSVWLQDFNPSPEMDAPIREFSRLISREDPSGALLWANTISDRQSRITLLEEIRSNWMARQPEAARSFYESHPEIVHE